MTFELKGVDAGYGRTQVLREVSLTVPEGTVVALFGPNGAGKTTLLRVASGLIRPTAGEIELDGTSLRGLPTHGFARAGICHVPEGRGVFPTMTVRENLLIQAPRGKGKETIEQAVEAFPRLGERLDQRAGTMSGGEQQFLAVAHAFVTRPRLVLLDEVSLGLAPLVVDEIFRFLRTLAATGVSILLVEQYVTRALAMADEVAILNQGRSVWSGAAADLDVNEVFRTYVGSSDLADADS